MSIEDLIPEVPADALLSVLFGEDAYAVGGRVRDAAIAHSRGLPVREAKDLDYVIANHELHEVSGPLGDLGLKMEMVGASFAVLKVRFGDDTIDISLPRRERSTGPSHRDFEIAYGPGVSIEDDIERRDFTINALMLNLADRRLVAPPGALDDVGNGLIRTISPKSFEDDPLRLLRAAQFASRLGFSIEPSTYAQMRDKASLVLNCSPERIRDELLKLLEKSDRPSVGIELLRDSGLLAHVLPELLEGVGTVQNRHHDFDVWNHVMAAVDASAAADHDVTTRLAVLMHDIGKPRTAVPRKDGQGNTFYDHEKVGAEMTQAIMRRLRFPDKFTERVVLLVRQHMYATNEPDGSGLTDAALRRFVRRVGADNVERQFEVRLADALGHGKENAVLASHNYAFQDRVRTIVEQQPVVAIRDLPLRGQDVIACLIEEGVFPPGYRGDRTVSVILEAMLEKVLDDPAQNDKDLLMAHCVDMVRRMAEERRDEAAASPAM